MMSLKKKNNFKLGTVSLKGTGVGSLVFKQNESKRFYNVIKNLQELIIEDDGIDHKRLDKLMEFLINEFAPLSQSPINPMTGRQMYVNMQTAKTESLMELFLPFLQAVPTFDVIHCCVTAVPIFLFIYLIGTIIYIAYSIHQFFNCLKNMPTLSFNLKQELKQKMRYSLTIITLRNLSRFLFFLLFIEIINPLNWTRFLLVFGGFFISTPSISVIVCLLLFFSWLIVRITLDLVIKLRIIVLDLAVILLFIIFFLLIIVYSNNFISFYLGIEGTALSTVVGLVLLFFFTDVTYTNIAHSTKNVFFDSQEIVINKYKQLNNYWQVQKNLNQDAIAAGLLYFLLNLFVTIALGYLFFFLLFHYNTLNFLTLFYFINLTTNITEILILSLLLLIVFCFKLGIAPFHFWLPGVFFGANYALLFFLAIPIKLVFSYMLFKFFFSILNSFYFIWGPIILLLGVCSVLVGSIGLYYENQVKRFFAYSTINHFGNMFLAFGTGHFMGQNAFLIYLLTYLLMNIVFIGYTSALINTKTKKTIFSFSELNNVHFTSTISQLCFAFTLLSMIGLPPFIGFWGKMVVLKSLLFIPSFLNFFLVFIIISTSVLAASSYLGIIKTLFITSFRNHELAHFFPFSIFTIKYLVFFTFIITFGFTVQFCPELIRLFELFILQTLLQGYFN